jgi:glycosyltransferase involved in cell wall biosynthesis
LWSKPNVLKKNVSECDVIQVEFPWQVGYLKRINEKRKPLVLVAHNVEACLWERFGSNGKKLSTYKSWVINKISRQEREAVSLVDAIIAVSEMDREVFLTLYGVEDEKVSVIPWGVDVDKYRFHSMDEKERAKESLGLSGKKVVVFSGALYEPNVEAVRFILDMAGGFGMDTLFLIVGRVGEAFRGDSLPNVRFTGFVDDPVKYFAAADVGVNPMQSGGGMHLKMLEYLSCGLPTVTTELGARGFRRPWEDYMMISDFKGFAGAVRGMLEDVRQREHYGSMGRKVVEEFYTWDRVAKERIGVYEHLCV